MASNSNEGGKFALGEDVKAIYRFHGREHSEVFFLVVHEKVGANIGIIRES